MILLPLAVMFRRIQYVRYVVIFSIMALHIFVFSDSTDFPYYDRLYALNAKADFVGSIEPGYQYIAYLFSILSGVKTNVDVFIFCIGLILILIIVQKFKLFFNSTDTYYSTILLILYISTYQLAYNFRTGVASLLVIIGVFSLNKILKYFYLIIAPSVHIQVFPISIVISFLQSSRIQRIIVIGFFVVVFLLSMQFFISFVYNQGIGYLNKFSGSVRLAGIPYLFIYLFVLRSKLAWGPPSIRYILLFGLAVNIIFFFNSHISARLTRAIEPLLMIAFYFELARIRPLLSSTVRLLLAMCPGMLFLGLEFLGFTY